MAARASIRHAGSGPAEDPRTGTRQRRSIVPAAVGRQAGTSQEVSERGERDEGGQSVGR